MRFGDPHSCPTCSDEASRWEILEIDGSDAICRSEAGRDERVAQAAPAPTSERIAIDLIVEPRVGDVVLVRAGAAIARVEASEPSRNSEEVKR